MKRKRKAQLKQTTQQIFDPSHHHSSSGYSSPRLAARGFEFHLALQDQSAASVIPKLRACVCVFVCTCLFQIQPTSSGCKGDRMTPGGYPLASSCKQNCVDMKQESTSHHTHMEVKQAPISSVPDFSRDP
eukprot:1159302-Pelagomonas_calceolata.AAC.12